MIDQLLSSWADAESLVFPIVAGVFVGIIAPLLLWAILEQRQCRWRKEADLYWEEVERKERGPRLRNVHYYDLALTAEQVKWLHDLPQPVWTAPWI